MINALRQLQVQDLAVSWQKMSAHNSASAYPALRKRGVRSLGAVISLSPECPISGTNRLPCSPSPLGGGEEFQILALQPVT